MTCDVSLYVDRSGTVHLSVSVLQKVPPAGFRRAERPKRVALHDRPSAANELPQVRRPPTLPAFVVVTTTFGSAAFVESRTMPVTLAVRWPAANKPTSGRIENTNLLI